MGYEFIVVRFLTFGMRIADKVPEGMSLIVIADNRGVTGKKLTASYFNTYRQGLFFQYSPA
jgi:hypothetical protein